MRLPSPRALAAAGVVLLVAFGVATGIWELQRGHHHRQAATTTTAAAQPTTTAPTTTAPPPTTTAPSGVTVTQNGVTIADARVSSLTPFAATVTWRTEPATSGRLAAALGSLPQTLWTSADANASTHTLSLGGLAFDSDYTLTVSATSGDGKQVEATLPVHTPRPDGASLVAATNGGAITLGGQPFFPLMTYGECPAGYGPILAAGVNLFANNPCGGIDAQLGALSGAALSASVAGETDMENPAVVGWFLPDEADARGLTARTLPAVPPSSSTGRLAFLTLSDHVSSVTSPPPGGRGVYRGLIAKADVVGFDFYPLQVMCWPDRIGTVYDAQRELGQLAPGKPTFQWIETAHMSCPATGATAVTAATVRAESWLAIAGGATGLGFFPGEWSPQVAPAIAEVTQQVKAIAPALLTPAVATSVDGPLRVSLHTLADGLYLVAANPSRRGAAATVAAKALGDRTLQPVGDGPPLASHNGAVRISLPPLGATVYVASP